MMENLKKMNVDFFVHFSLEKEAKVLIGGKRIYAPEKNASFERGKRPMLYFFRKKRKSQGAKSENTTTSQYVDFFD